MPRLTILCAASVAALITSAAPALGAPAAVEPEELARAERIDDAVPFVSPKGEQLVAWKVEAGLERATSIRARSGGAWSAPDELSQDFSIRIPEIVFDRQGTAFAVWGQGHTGARSAIRPAFGTFGGERPTGACGWAVDADVGGPNDRLAIGCSGTIGTAWPNVNGFFFGIRTGLGNADTSWHPQTGIADQHILPRVSVGADGSWAAAAKQSPDGKTDELHVLVAPAGGGQTTGLKKIASRPESGYLEGVWLEALPDGSVAAITNTDLGPKLYLRPKDGAFAEHALPAGRVRGAEADAAGTLHVVLEDEGPDDAASMVVTKPLGGPVGDPVPIVPRGQRSPWDIAVTPDGTEHVMLLGDVVEVATRPAGASTFRAPIRVAGEDARWPSFTAGADGDVIVGWTRKAADQDERAMVGGIDGGAAPALRGVTAPAALGAGHAGRFAATATDSMGVAGVRWDFGDGTRADGAEAEHAYDRPGTYTATVTATDRAGNRSTATRTVVVEGPQTIVREVAAAPAPGSAQVRSTAPTAGDRTAPTLTLAAPATVRGRTLTVRITANEPVTVAATLTAGRRRLAGGALDVVRGPRTLALKAKGRRLAKAGTKLTLRIVATDVAGNRRTITRTLAAR